MESCVHDPRSSDRSNIVQYPRRYRRRALHLRQRQASQIARSAPTNLIEQVAASSDLHEQVEGREVPAPRRLLYGELSGADELEDVLVLESGVDAALFVYGLCLPVGKVGRDYNDLACCYTVVFRMDCLVHAESTEMSVSPLSG